MHKRLVNYCKIEFTLTPLTPILIKSGKEGADPTKPDMEFVETYHPGGRSVYLPGSSLKGAIRAHAERIVRTVGKDKRPKDPQELWANDPLYDDYKYLEKKEPPDVYRLSSFTDRMFGNTAIASRIRIKDAYPVDVKKLKLSERNGVAIDRMFGSVAVGPFNYEVCTAGEFKTEIHLKNFTLAQLGLIGLVLRDLNEGWFGIGFAKSRGLGLVEVQLNSAVVQYPGCEIKDDEICLLGGTKKWSNTKLLGVGAFLEIDEANSYGFPTNEEEETPIAATDMDLGFGVQLIWQGEVQVKDLFNRSVKAWRRKL
ncbi:RAMP superfamily CRISPR-associated protein [Oscillatoria salina]|uniref:RAMP superfamily CRISPR-associated protein n=1 Tax=Oscillatoria salina TaxID=331517 RepID=UPI001CCB5A67|nr:RAMP superfamily CRISPR-associated protein [Oscillatoria salina]MBZ8181456.1 CRISPR-associated protein [Oscillatoria salina IIICB1]